MATQLSIDCATLRLMYEIEQLSMASIAARLGCSVATISNRLRRCGVAARPGRFARCEVPTEQLRQLYSEQRLPLRQIAAQLGVSVSTINNRRRAAGLPARGRPRQEA